MKTLPFVVWLTLIAAAARLDAYTVPVFEDTSARNGSMTKGTGIAGNLTVASDRPAFVRFDLSAANALVAGDVGRARLILYLQKVVKPGSLKLHAVTSDWTESVLTPAPQPTMEPDALATIVIGAGMSRQFVTIDVTDQVKSWLTAPETDFGFAITSDGTASVLLGTKEGPGSGYPAALDIEKSSLIGNSHVAPGIDVVKLGNGSVDNNEFTYLDGLTGAIQLQIDQLNSTIENATQALEQKLNKAGDTMTGSLTLPGNGFTVGTDQLSAALGRIGIGTTAPAAKLDVRGDVKLGFAGQYFAVSGEENFRIIRGTVRNSGGTLTIESGSGFTISALTSGGYTVTFTTPFSGKPTVSVGLEINNTNTSVSTKTVNPSGMFITGASLDGTATHFIAVGPR